MDTRDTRILEIVKLTQADACKIAELEEKSFPHAWTEKQIETIIADEHFLFYGLLNDLTLLSYISVQHIAGEMEVLNLATLPHERRKGYARRLLELTIKIGEYLKVEEILLEVRLSNFPAQALYTTLGFKQVGSRKGYYTDAEGKPEDALVMKYVFPKSVI